MPHFYQMALGSMRECQAILILIEVKDAELLDQADHFRSEPLGGLQSGVTRCVVTFTRKL